MIYNVSDKQISDTPYHKNQQLWKCALQRCWSCGAHRSCSKPRHRWIFLPGCYSAGQPESPDVLLRDGSLSPADHLRLNPSGRFPGFGVNRFGWWRVYRPSSEQVFAVQNRFKYLLFSVQHYFYGCKSFIWCNNLWIFWIFLLKFLFLWKFLYVDDLLVEQDLFRCQSRRRKQSVVQVRRRLTIDDNRSSSILS